MLISDLAIAIAAGAFLITQVHLWRVAKKLIRKSEQSWTKAEHTIFESSKTIHDDVLKQIQAAPQTSGLDDAKTQIAELGSRVDKIQGGLREAFTTFGTSLEAKIDSFLPKLPSAAHFAGDPKGAQAAGVEARKINQIMQTLEAGAGTGGNLLGAVNDLAGILETLGEPSLADWLQNNPETLPKIYSRLSRNPRLAQGLAQLEAKMTGGLPGAPMSRGNGGMMNPGIQR
jgi:hypothetical protein